MHYRVLQTAISTRPFVPFDVVMSSGSRHRVAHPDNLTILKDSIVIPFYDQLSDSDAGPGDDIVRASYLHIAALEPVRPRESASK